MARLGAALIPCLRVRDLAVTIGFYEKLGFKVSGRYDQEGQLVWCEMGRDDARIQFHGLDHPEMPNTPILSGILYFRPDDVRAL
ncbi:MAG: VOC family protein, partial [Hyphomicrobium sp.]